VTRLSFLLVITIAALAQPKHRTVLFHGSLAVGAINKDAGGNQFWCEAEV
jgi:hypothetical protein